MSNIEKRISPLIESMFPSFYNDEGQNFVQFIKAYFEWLEENHQRLILEDATNFNVGDTITQDDITGTIIAVENDTILVLVNENKTFKCFNVCAELIAITSSSGGDTYILRGGNTKRMGAIFWARNLMSMRDIDTTLDLFIVRFKEKYLKNIEFGVETNKELLIKNALNLYRAKGTERAIDLFFRLVYGTNTQVNYPGDNLFKLSEGEWVKPRYIEITSSSSDRAITLVGKQITGVTSGATAFVEKYIKRRIKDGFVHVLYVSNITGNFDDREILRGDNVYSDSPRIVSSLNSVTVTQGSKDFNVGDIVSFNSVRGDYGLARVAEVEFQNGIVDFIFLEGGYGYTVSSDTSLSAAELAKRTQSLVSEKVLVLANVSTTNSVATINISNGGVGYSNTDQIKITSIYANTVGTISTNATGGISYVTITNTGSGFINSSPTVLITNSTGGSSAGSNAVLVANATEQSTYFRYFENVVQPFVTLDYNAATNASALVVGSVVTLGNSTVNASGLVISSSNTYADVGNLVISVINNGVFGGVGNSVKLSTNSSVSAVINAISNTSASGVIMGVPNTAVLAVTTISGTINLGDEVYQVAANNTESANGIVTLTNISGTAGNIDIEDLRGVFKRDRAFAIRNSGTTGTVSAVEINVGLYNVSNNFNDALTPGAFSTTTGTTGNVSFVSRGYGAGFKVGTITESETVALSTDLLSANNKPVSGANQSFMSIPLAANAYGFPKNPLGNSSATIFSCLNFDSFTIGTIGSLDQINPGVDYDIDPFVLAYQPYIAGFNYRDYVINTRNTTGVFLAGEKILQTNTSIQKTSIVVSEETGFEVGDTVYQTNSISSNSAVGTIDSVTPSTNTITVRSVTGTYVVTAGGNSALKSVSSAQSAITYSTATNNQLYVAGANVVLGTRATFAANSISVIVANSTQSGYIRLGTVDTARLANNDVVVYHCPSSNSSIVGLTPNDSYLAIVSNSTVIQLANSTGGVMSLTSVTDTFQQHQIIKVNAYGGIITNANNTLANANGVLTAKITAGYIRVADTLYAASNLEIQSNATSFANSVLSSAIISTANASFISTAKAIVKQSGNNILYAKRIQFDNMFTANSLIQGSSSGATAYIVNVYEDDVLPIGINAQIEANPAISNGAITQLQIVDSGVGYANGEDMFFVSSDLSRSGKARASVTGTGTGSGYYKTSKGFLSSVSKLHDGDYYQEYSYEIMSRIPFDKYKDMFKKVLHTSGTRFFGSVLIEETTDATVSEVVSRSLTTKASNTLVFSGGNVVNGFIQANNQYTNGQLKFAVGDQVTYSAPNGAYVLYPLVNSAAYYVVSANATSLSLASSSREYTYPVANATGNSTVNLVRHNILSGDTVTYTGNSSSNVQRLVSNQQYYISTSNSSAVQLKETGRQYQVQNYWVASEEFDRTSWLKTAVSVVPNTVSSPTGTITAGKLVEDSADSVHYARKASIGSYSGLFIISTFVKAAEREVISLYMDDEAGTSVAYDFNLTTQVITQRALTSVWSSPYAYMQHVGNGWFRCVVVATRTTAASIGGRVSVGHSGVTVWPFGQPSYLGDGTSGLYVWGAQLEINPGYPTAGVYVPTTATTTANSSVWPNVNVSDVVLANSTLAVNKININTVGNSAHQHYISLINQV